MLLDDPISTLMNTDTFNLSNQLSLMDEIKQKQVSGWVWVSNLARRVQLGPKDVHESQF